jgi:hypothetical protein
MIKCLILLIHFQAKRWNVDPITFVFLGIYLHFQNLFNIEEGYPTQNKLIPILHNLLHMHFGKNAIIILFFVWKAVKTIIGYDIIYYALWK